MAPLQFLPPLVCLQLERSLAAFCCCAVPTAMLSGLPPVHDCLPSHQCTWNSMKVVTNTLPHGHGLALSGYSDHQGYIKILWTTITDQCIKMLWTTITDQCIKMLWTRYITDHQGYIKMLWTISDCTTKATLKCCCLSLTTIKTLWTITDHQGYIKMLWTITDHQGYIKMLWTITDHWIKMLWTITDHQGYIKMLSTTTDHWIKFCGLSLTTKATLKCCRLSLTTKATLKCCGLSLTIPPRLH